MEREVRAQLYCGALGALRVEGLRPRHEVLRDLPDAFLKTPHDVRTA